MSQSTWDEILDLLETAVANLQAERDAARSGLTEAYLVLREVEWEGYDGGPRGCPSCLESQKDGHAPDCALAAILAKHSEPEPTT